MNTLPAYGLWSLVIINSTVFIIFAFSFVHPKTKHDWRSFGPFSAFIIALFTEMYGFPLTIYLLSGWLSKRYPGINIYSHDAGHLWETIFGWGGNPHLNPLHLFSYIFIFWGFSLLAGAWKILYAAQKERRLATTGPYAKIRHPQYVGFVLIMFGFLLQWPTLLTFTMFPILLIVYALLAQREEADTLKKFGEEYKQYIEKTPAFFPYWRSWGS